MGKEREGVGVLLATTLLVVRLGGDKIRQRWGD
jgi:hypothetical protein